MIQWVKYQYDIEINGRKFSFSVSLPLFFGIGLGSVLSLLLFCTLIALLSMAIYRWTPLVYLAGAAWYYVTAAGLINANRDDPEMVELERNARPFNFDWLLGLTKFAIALLWPLAFIMTAFHDWFFPEDR